jgi:hypothetical protein
MNPEARRVIERNTPDEGGPACMVRAGYWRRGLRWQVVLHVTYWVSATERVAGGGPVGMGSWFVVDRAWRERTAKAKVAEIEDRLRESRDEAARRHVPTTYPSAGEEA